MKSVQWSIQALVLASLAQCFPDVDVDVLIRDADSFAAKLSARGLWETMP